MLKDGAPEGAVDMVLGEDEPYEPPDTPEAHREAGENFVPLFVGVGAASILSTIVIVLLGVSAAVATKGAGGFVLVALLGLALEIAGAAAIGRRRRGLSTGLLVMLALTPLIVAALMLGACALILTNINPH
jgi:hypothetical protein